MNDDDVGSAIPVVVQPGSPATDVRPVEVVAAMSGDVGERAVGIVESRALGED